MKLEQIVTSRELSEKLSKYIKGESLFYHSNDKGKITRGANIRDFIRIPAWTATELAELMKDVDWMDFMKAYKEVGTGATTFSDVFIFTDPNKLGEILLWLCERELINLK